MQAVVDEADREAGEDGLAAADRFVRRGARHGIAGVRGIARFRRRAGLQHLGAGRALGILQVAVLLHDERAAQRNHHQDAEQSAEDRDQHDARDLEIEAEDHDRRHRHAEAEGDRLAGRAGGLHDVVLENRRVAQPSFGKEPEERDRDDRHRDRRADRQADLEHEVERRRAEDHAEQRADDERQRRQLAQPRARRNERTEAGENRVLRLRANDVRELVRRIARVDFCHADLYPRLA